MVQKEQNGETPNCEDIGDINMYNKSPSKEKKQTIVAGQLAQREKKAVVAR